ncbi:hypothetical protein ABFX02_07G102700 [Erythranthe guttata]
MTTLPNDQVLSILPIVGMGGLGKTTVARNVLDHEAIKAHFAKRFWVHVSQNFDAKILFNKILTSLTGTNAALGDKQAVLEKLQKELGAHRFLLVLDDVWNENHEIWGDFINSLRKITSATGNGIVVTTRSENVASLVKTFPTMHKLNNLLENECWSIIKTKSFGEGDIPSEFERIGVSIAKRCQGLPLAAKVVGGLLRDKSIDEWMSIDEKWLSDLKDENPVFKILKLSFDHLSPPSLKKCFAYCSIYPKGYDLESKRLVELWMAEGFLGGNDDMEILGNKFFNRLLENSLLLQVENTSRYNMHDLVHDLASSILNSSDQVRYMGRQSCASLNEQATWLRSLLSNDKICILMFSKFKSLHVLILMDNCVEELPNSIKELIHLRCLDVSDTELKCLPDSIGELYHLQTLRASDDLEKLPNTLKNLIGLRHLLIPGIELPPEMGRLTSLRTLPYFGVGDEKGCRISELECLKNLEGKLEIFNLEKVHDKEEAKRADLLQKPKIVELVLKWSNREGGNGDESVLEGLQPHPNLESLKICGFGGRSLPSWCSNMPGLNKLMEIRLERCKECEQVPMLGHLPHLKNLYLDGLVNVRSIGSSFYGIDEKCVSFPALEMLELRGMSELTEWLQAELRSAAPENDQRLVVFPRLEYLQIIYCRQLKSAPSHFPCLKELLIDGVESELPLVSICGINLISLTKLHIHSIDGLTCLPNCLFRKNQNLSMLVISGCRNLTHLVPCLEGGGTALRNLEIWDCPELRELPDDLHTLSALENLAIYGCSKLKTIPYPYETHNDDDDEQLLLGLSCLRRLFIEYCDELTNLPIELCAESLESLTLRGLMNLRMTMGTLIGYCMQKMPRLSELRIVDVPTTNNPWEIVGSVTLGNLRDLTISCDEYSVSAVDAILKASAKSLHRLTLLGTEHSRELPGQLQHLTALSELGLYDFGEMEELSDWLIGNNNNNNLSSSLQILHLSRCKKLRYLPSKEAMLHLTKLYISNCPMLHIKGGDSDYGSEWPKISHIPYVVLDWVQIPTHAQ